MIVITLLYYIKLQKSSHSVYFEKKKNNETKAVNEKYDEHFKTNQTRTNGSNVWGGNQNETIPNPTVHPHERKIADGKHPDEDINNAARKVLMLADPSLSQEDLKIKKKKGK